MCQNRLCNVLLVRKERWAMHITDFYKTKELLLKCINERNFEAELRIHFYNKENDYMIIIYEDKCSFQRCGINDGSGETFYNSLDDLYNSRLVDGIYLKYDWSKIDKMDCAEFEIFEFV